MAQYGTVQQRSKSTSPIKKQETLEWKKRLLKGQVGYGDQTDLFGPSGLENIFATPRDSSPQPPKKSRMSFLERSEMPSSPPVWPLHEGSEEGESYVDRRLTAVEEETEEGATSRRENGAEDSFEGNSEETQEDPPHLNTSPERWEPTEPNAAANRTVSGQTDCDDFSPVFVSKHTSVNGQVEYRALDSHLVKKFHNLSFDSKKYEDVTQCSDDQVQKQDCSTFTDGPESESELPSAGPDLSLSENLPTGTPPSVAGLGGNVQFSRGGFSSHGSFKDRPLSPSPTHQAAQSTSSVLSPSINRMGRQALLPIRVPTTPASQDDAAEPRSKSSGSPLKLFGPHDTFTSNRLLRRMSQLDPDLAAIRESNRNRSSSKANQRQVSDVSFGSGSLSHHQFDAKITIISASESDKDDSDSSPRDDVPPPGSRLPSRFKAEASPLTKDSIRLKRRRSALTSAGSTLDNNPKKTAHLQPTVESVTDLSKITEKTWENSFAMGKRPPNSPYKAPTPKRRRTLHASELENEEDVDQSELSYDYDDQERDFSAGKIQDLREALRPRNPTPSQRRREQIEAEIRATAEQFAIEAPAEMEAVMEQIETSMASASPPTIQQQARAVANEVAKFSLRVQKASADHSERKRSVTTQDFFHEAVMVMRLIREKAGRQSGLGSIGESEQEGNSINLDNSSQDLSALRVSRPPSREVPSGWRSRQSHHSDARVVSQLRRFQETEDTDFIADPGQSVHVDDDFEYDNEYVAVDEHSNIRIRRPLPHAPADGEASRPSSQRSNESHSTDTNSTGQTQHTDASRKSDNVGTLAPEHVAHLIGEQVGAMHYDKDKQQWVKTKSPQKSNYGSFLEPPSNITSDDDPFREISDLPVDERKEEEIRKASCQGRRLSELPSEVTNPADVEDQDDVQHNESRTTSQETVLARPATASEDNRSRYTQSTSEPSRYTAFGSSQHQTNETRATSWGDEDMNRLISKGTVRQQPLMYAAQTVMEQRSEAKIIQKSHNPIIRESATRQPWETIAEESLVSEKDDVGDSTLDEVNQTSEQPAGLRDNTVVDQEEPELDVINPPKLRRTPAQGQSTIYRNMTTRTVSLRRQTYTSRFNAEEAMEQSELSFIASLPGERMMSLSLSVSRPMNKRQNFNQVTEQPSSPNKYDPSYILSDLPDFTVHEQDYERPSERALARRLAKHAAEEVHDRYALSIKDLVKTLTDVAADEPYWEQKKQLDIHGQGVSSLHGLSDFCGRVQDMDVSDNKLAYLNGAPATIRNLIARGNMLTSLTPWTHLMNLQYLDISSNHLNSLSGLDCLLHLRELKADDNQITSLDGVLHLDGLLKLRLRRNRVHAVDFGDSLLQRLEELDLCSNEVTSIRDLDCLTSLRSLMLDNNPLREPPTARGDMTMLTHLSVRACRLGRLNVTNMPALTTLYADENRLPDITGIETLKALDVLSLRKQILSPTSTLTILEHAIHARTIRLSGTPIPTLHLPTSLLSLQHLEAASIGLQTLPPDFGLCLPNLTTLNLNFNSLRDIRPLLNIQKLRYLSVSGNRLDRLRKSVATLSKLPTLHTLDLRDNPLTLGFYAPLTGTLKNLQTSIIRRDATPDHERDGDEDEDALYERTEALLYNLPSRDRAVDGVHYERLDDSTKLHRRVCHLMLGASCAGLEELDGMSFDKRDAMVKDRVWERLVELGIMRRSGEVGLKRKGEEVGSSS
jgi:hypothetical protein